MPDEVREIEEAEALIRRLPDTYAKEKSSRLFRLFRVIAAEFAQVRDALQTTERYRDIDQASGYTLDLLGSNVDQERGQVSDYTYRGLIKGRIARNLSAGDVDDIKQIVSVMLSIPVSEVTVTPLWRRIEQEPAAVEIAAPLTALAQYQLPPERWAQIMQLIVAAGVRAAVLLRGTFAFSQSPDQVEYDEKHGFSDEDRKQGGTLGAYYDAPTPELPIVG